MKHNVLLEGDAVDRVVAQEMDYEIEN